MLKSALMLGALLSAGSAAGATDPSAPAATTVAPVVARANPQDKMVCKAQVETGTRLGGHKVCMKKADWDAQAADARRQRDFAPPAGIAGAH